MNKIAVVIPTILNRPEYFPIAYQSVHSQEGEFELKVFVGCPKEIAHEVLRVAPDAVVLKEPSTGGLGAKLDSFLKIAAQESDFIAWLGDDDLLTSGSLAIAAQLLAANPQTCMVYGACDYIDEKGQTIFNNRSGPWAAKMLTIGPQLIPQPGSLMRSSSFLATGGLVDDFNLAFDFDLFLKLKKQGPMVYVPTTLAQFRWHPNSLSVKRRLTSALEASRVRRSHYKGLARLLWPLWEPFTISATWIAGKLVNAKTKRQISVDSLRPPT